MVACNRRKVCDRPHYPQRILRDRYGALRRAIEMRTTRRDRASRGAHARVNRIGNFTFAPRVSPSTRLKGDNSMSMKLMITAAAVVVALADPALAGNHRDNDAHARAVRYLSHTTARASVERGLDAEPRGAFDSPPELAGYPTDYLMNRFGDRQMQGR
jgi:hypothetical protein